MSSGALGTDDGKAIAAEIGELLESELVRFVHRVEYDHGIELDRARAAMVLLTKLLAGGVAWTPHVDSAPDKVAAAFGALADRNPGWPPSLTVEIRAEVDAFVAATKDLEVEDDPPRTTAALLRRSGAAPEMWWWAAGYGAEHETCWKAARAHSERMVQVALAVGVAPDAIGRALAAAFTVAATRAKTRRIGQRNDLVALLGRLASTGFTAITRDQELVGKATALAFEMTAAQESWWTAGAPAPGAPATAGKKKPAADDGIADIAVLSFQLVELFTAAAKGRADPERFGALAARADKALAHRGLRLAALLQRDLDPPFSDAVRKVNRARTVVTRAPS